MNQKFCQCCGMPLENETMYGTEKDGSKNEDYCNYCYENGAVTFPGTMEEMIAICVPHMMEANPDMTAEQATQQMQAYFPTLKHWQQAAK